MKKNSLKNGVVITVLLVLIGSVCFAENLPKINFRNNLIGDSVAKVKSDCNRYKYGKDAILYEQEVMPDNTMGYLGYKILKNDKYYMISHNNYLQTFLLVRDDKVVAYARRFVNSTIYDSLPEEFINVQPAIIETNQPNFAIYKWQTENAVAELYGTRIFQDGNFFKNTAILLVVHKK